MKKSNRWSKFYQKVTQVMTFKRWMAFIVAVIAIPAIGQLANMALLNQVFEEASYYTNFYGDGKDGAYTLNGTWVTPTSWNGAPTSPASINTTRSYLTADASAGGSSLSIQTSYTSTSFDSGGSAGFSAYGPVSCATTTNCIEVLIMQMGGTTAGTYEFALVSQISGGTLTLSSALKNSYVAANKVQVIKVPRYTTMTFNSGAHLSVGQWDNNTGGVIVFRANGAVTMSSADSGGGRYIAKIVAGYWQDNPGSAGYGFGVTGTNAYDAFDITAANSTYDGKSVSPGSISRIIMGSGGNGTGGTGGKGGGIVIAKVNSIALDAKVIATGQNGSSAQGGGSGTIYLAADTFSGTCSSAVTAAATTGASAGDAGRIFMNYTNSIATACVTTGTPNSVATVRKAYLK